MTLEPRGKLASTTASTISSGTAKLVAYQGCVAAELCAYTRMYAAPESAPAIASCMRLRSWRASQNARHAHTPASTMPVVTGRGVSLVSSTRPSAYSAGSMSCPRMLDQRIFVEALDCTIAPEIV
jgi:hypothetical protein